MVGAFLFAELQRHGTGSGLAFLGAVGAGAALGLVTQTAIMELLRNAAPLTRTIVTLGVLTALQAAAEIRYTQSQPYATQFLPAHTWTLGGVQLQTDRLTLLGISAAVTFVLALAMRRTTVGLAILAASANERAAAALGWSPRVLASLTWTIGGALAGAVGAFVAPIAGLDVTNLTLLVVPALAAGLIGRFDSFLVTFLGAVGIGIAQTLSLHYVTQPGFQDAIPFLVIIVVLVLTGRSLPLRSHITERLPSVGTGVIRPLPTVAGAALAIVLMLWVFPVDWQSAFTVSFSFAVVLLSMVVLTGYAGQISLAQYAVGGLGAYVAGRLVSTQGWPFWAAALAGIAFAVPAGAALAIPALRTRGITLAVVTLGLGFAIERLLFENLNYSGGSGGTPIGFTKLFGYDIDATLHPARYAVFVIVVFVVCALAVANVRRSAVGRRMLAIRANERAAASLGVSVIGAKLYAFSIAAAIAAIGGILIAFRQPSIVYPDFGVMQSVYAIAFAVVGGVGFVLGPLIGSGFTSGGFGILFNHLLSGIDKYIVVIGGISVIVTILLNPDGLVSSTLGHWAAAGRRVFPVSVRDWWTRPNRPHGLATADRTRVEPRRLDVRGVTVTFGAVRAVDDVTMRVEPGEIVGLIGPNGAGKTTLVDAITGFVRPALGSIALGDTDLGSRPAHRRVRAGVARSWQSLELFDDVSVFENLQVAADGWHWTLNLRALFLPQRPRLNPSAAAAVSDFDLAGDLYRKPTDLPYGRRRLVAIARAVALNPSVLLLDEPAAGLSATEREELSNLLRQLSRDWGMGILLIEHDLELVLGVCDRIVVINFGSVISSGTPLEVRNDPQVIAAYLGEPDAVDSAAAPATAESA